MWGICGMQSLAELNNVVNSNKKRSIMRFKSSTRINTCSRYAPVEIPCVVLGGEDLRY